MRDGEMVAAIVSGDPAALAATYDHYAPALYGYCRSLLSDICRIGTLDAL